VFYVQGVAIYENGKKTGVNLGVGGNFVNLLVGKLISVRFFIGGHNRNRTTKLLQFLCRGAGQHTKLAGTLVIPELLADDSTILAIGKSRYLFEILLD
jgi:hypothetical protein